MFNQIRLLFSNKILKSSAGILSITLFVKVLGYAEKMILANYFGTSYQVDVYTVVLTIVLSIFFFFREIIEPGFLNVFLDYRSKNKVDESWRLFNIFFRLILFLTIVLSVVAIVYPHMFSGIFAPGFNVEKLTLTNKLIRIVIPASIFLALSTLTSITLNGLKIFVLPASGELVFKAGIIICMVLFYKEYGITGAAIGIVMGTVGKLGVHMIKLYNKISFNKVTIESNYKKRIWHLTWPLLIGVSFSQISNLIDNVFASYLQEGAIAALSYAKKVVELPVILFPYVISIVIFPYFTQLAVEKQQTRLKKLLGNSLKWILITFIPISAFFIIYSIPIIEIIFQRGAFNANSTMQTAKPFLVYSTGLLFIAIETIIVVFYYSNADTKTPVFVGIICVGINIILTWIFIQLIGYIGIALAFVIQKCFKNLVLIYLLKYKISYKRRDFWKFIVKIIFPTTIYIVIVLTGKYLTKDLLSYNKLIETVLIGFVFMISGLIYIWVGYYTKIFKLM